MGERTRTRLRWAGIAVALICAAAVWVVPMVLTTSDDDCPIAPGASGGTRWDFDGRRYVRHASPVRQVPVGVETAGTVELRACENQLLETYPALALPGVPIDRAFVVTSTGSGETSRFPQDTLFVAEHTDVPEAVRSLLVGGQ